MSKKKVLICSGIFPPDIGGPAFYVPLLAGHLHSQSITSTVLTYTDQPQTDSYDFKVVRILRKKMIFLREVIAFFKILKLARNADVIYANGQFFKSALAAKMLNKKLVAKIVGDEAWERLRNWGAYQGTIDEYQKESHKSFKMKLVDWLRAFPLTLADQVIVPSCYLKNIVEGWHPKIKGKVKVVYNSFNLPEVERKASDDSRKKMVTVCRLVNWKGVDRIISLLKKDEDLSLTVVGGGPLEQELKDLSLEMGVAERVLFTGNVNKELVAKHMSSSDIFILNSSYEGLPHVVLEAMSLQIPVIATDVGGTSEVVKNDQTGILIESENDEQLFQAVHKIKNDKDYADRLAKSGYDLVKQEFNKALMLDKTTEILQA